MLKNQVKQKFGKYPFIIHGYYHFVVDTYPTHSHGLNDKGWPEFMIDPACYGLDGNNSLIHAAYDYFKRPRKKKFLNRILNGKTIEIPIDKLWKRWNGTSYPICFRLVPNTFEAVKLAYGPGGMDVDPDLVVVQIYVKGDDFALTDEYYEGGITW